MKKPSQETLNKYQSHPEIIETIDYECKNNSISKKKLIIIITGLIINFTALILNTISKSSQIILNIACIIILSTSLYKHYKRHN